MESISYKYNTLNKKFSILKENLQLPLVINYLFIIYAFSIPINGALTNAVFTTIIILWILDGNLKEKFLLSIQNKFVIAILLYYSLQIAWLWSSENIDFAKETIRNTRFLLYVIIYISAIKKEFIFKILSGFIYAMMFSEIVSYLIYFQIIPPINNAKIDDPVPFVLSHTTYALYLSISVGLMLFMSFKNNTKRIMKTIYLFFFISASINIFIIGSRLGFILYFSSILIVITTIYKFNIKKIFLFALPIIIIGYTLAYNLSPLFQHKVKQTLNSFSVLINEKNFGTSLGSRAGHWYYSADIIKENLFFGVGDGDQKTLVKENIISLHEKNAFKLNYMMQNGLHSEILDILVKFGLIGLIVYLNIFYQLIKYKPISSIFNTLKILLVFSFIFSAIQGGAIVENVKDLGKIFTLLAILVTISHQEKTDKKANT